MTAVHIVTRLPRSPPAPAADTRRLFWFRVDNLSVRIGAPGTRGRRQRTAAGGRRLLNPSSRPIPTRRRRRLSEATALSPATAATDGRIRSYEDFAQVHAYLLAASGVCTNSCTASSGTRSSTVGTSLPSSPARAGGRCV